MSVEIAFSRLFSSLSFSNGNVMEHQSFSSVVVIAFFALTLIIYAESPAFAQLNVTSPQEDSAGGQADVRAVEMPSLRSEDVQQATPDLEHRRTIPIGRTEQGRTSKDRANRGEDELTTKPVGKPR
jgi:hypothetical protein